MKKQAILSYSGGMDSTCVLLYLLSKNYEVKCYSFEYGQKHSIELEKSKENIEFLRSKGFSIDHSVIDLTDCFSTSQSSLSKHSGIDIPEGHYEDENMKSTVVENRNVIFSSIIYGKALSWVKESKNPVEIFLGIHSGDHAIYKDCTPESRMACELAFKISNDNSQFVNYKAPFIDIDKGGVLIRGLAAMEYINQIEISYNRPPLFNETEICELIMNTHTCYSPKNVNNHEGDSKEIWEPCGKCGACIERNEAIDFAMSKTHYALR